MFSPFVRVLTEAVAISPALDATAISFEWPLLVLAFTGFALLLLALTGFALLLLALTGFALLLLALTGFAESLLGATKASPRHGTEHTSERGRTMISAKTLRANIPPSSLGIVVVVSLLSTWLPSVELAS
jgi:hypothetical protein